MCTVPNVYVGLINFLAKNFWMCRQQRQHEEGNSHFGVSALNFISNMWCWCHKSETFSVSSPLAGSIEKSLSVKRQEKSDTNSIRCLHENCENRRRCRRCCWRWGLIELKKLSGFLIEWSWLVRPSLIHAGFADELAWKRSDGEGMRVTHMERCEIISWWKCWTFVHWNPIHPISFHPIYAATSL